jgi:hypothetical protein
MATVPMCGSVTYTTPWDAGQLGAAKPKRALLYHFYDIQAKHRQRFIYRTSFIDRRAEVADKKEAIEIICPKCKRTEILYITREDMPKCPDCDVRMVIRELLKEGKSF